MAAPRHLQRQVHVACRELGLDQDDRHALQLRVTGKVSMSDMDESDLRGLLGALKKDGFKPRSTRRKAPAPRADLRLVHVLWRQLGDAGALRKPGRAGLNAFIRARFEASWGAVPADIDMLRDHRQISDVIDALKSWCARAGIVLEEGRR